MSFLITFSAGSDSQGVTMKVIIYVLVFSICNGIGTPLLALLDAIKAFNSASTVFHLQIAHTIIFEILDSSNRICQDLTRLAFYPNSLQFMGNVDGFPAYVEHIFANSLWQNFLATALVVVLTGTPCQSISRGARLTNRRWFGLHAAPSNVWHAAHHGLVNLHRFLGYKRLITMCENVIPFNSIDLNHLDRTAGFRQDMNPLVEDGITRPRFAWTSTKVQFLKPWEQIILHFARLPPGWKYNMTVAFPTLRACFPFLFWKHIQDPLLLSPSDKATVQACYIYSPQGWRLPTIELWMQFMGLPSNLHDAFKLSLACTGNIKVFKDTGVDTYACGIHCYCDNCCQVLQALGESWNLQVATRFLKDLLWTHMTIREDEDVGQFYDYGSTIPFHICSGTCNLRRQSP